MAQSLFSHPEQVETGHKQTSRGQGLPDNASNFWASGWPLALQPPARRQRRGESGLARWVLAAERPAPARTDTLTLSPGLPVCCVRHCQGHVTGGRWTHPRCPQHVHIGHERAAVPEPRLTATAQCHRGAAGACKSHPGDPSLFRAATFGEAMSGPVTWEKAEASTR